MKVRARNLILLFIFFLAIPAFHLSAQDSAEMTIAAAPFENITGSENYDYIGFQVSEYLSTALASFKNVTVIERANLMAIIKEQNLQLSGITSTEGAVNIGEIANARQMLVGSYDIQGNNLILNGRLVDVETGEVLASGSAENGVTGDIRQVIGAFLKNLLTGQEAYNFDLGVEATLVTIDKQRRESTERIAKALSASFQSRDEEALKLLEESLAESQLDWLGYDTVAEAYIKTLQDVEGQSIYATLVKNQLDHNEKLVEEAKRLSIYRNTIKLLVERLEQTVTRTPLELAVGSEYSIDNIGTVSVDISPPSDFTVSMNSALRQDVESLLRNTSLVTVTSGVSGTSVDFTRWELPTVGKLFPVFNSLDGMKKMFGFSIEGSVALKLQFMNRAGDEVLFEMSSEPVQVVSLGTGRKMNLSTTVDDMIWYVERGRSGWRYDEGMIKVQAREMRDIGPVTVMIDQERSDWRVSFPMERDIVWESVLTHQFRKNSVKVAVDANDPMPEVKAAQITDALFSVGGGYMKGIPRIDPKNTYAVWTDLKGVVYWADETEGTLAAKWSGLKEGHEPDAYVGALSPDAAIIFTWPRGFGEISNLTDPPTIALDINFGTSRLTQTAELSFGGGWSRDDREYDLDDADWSALRDNMLIYSDDSKRYTTTVLDIETGRKTRSVPEGNGWIIERDGSAYVFDEGKDKVYSFDLETGAVTTLMTDYNFDFDYPPVFIRDGVVAAYSRYSRLTAIDLLSGTELWKNNEDLDSIDCLYTFGDILVGKRGEYVKIWNSVTGECTYEKDRDARWICRYGDQLLIADRYRERVNRSYEYRNRIAAYDPLKPDGEPLWTLISEKALDSGELPLVIGDTLYVNMDDGAAAFDLASRTLLWHNEDARLGRYLSLYGDYIIGSNMQALDRTTGTSVWTSSYSVDRMYVAGDRLVLLDDSYEMTVVPADIMCPPWSCGE